MKRRDFLVLSAGLSAAAAAPVVFGAQPKKDESVFEWKDVAGVRVGIGQGGNSTLIDGKEVAYLVDTKNSPWGRALRREASHGAPRLVVIITHHHADHTGGNHAFVKDMEVLAHEKCLPRIDGNVARYISQIKEGIGAFRSRSGASIDKAREDWSELYKHAANMKADEFRPTRAVKDSETIDTKGGAKLELRHFGPGHTDNDLVVHVPERNVLIAGDLLFHKIHPYVDPDGGGTVSGWVASLRRVIELCDAKTTVIPGHGETCGVEGLKAQVAYFEKVQAAVARALEKGLQRKDIVTMKLSFPGYANPDRASMALIGVYNELAPKP